MFLVSPKNQITTIREYKHNITSWNIWKPSIHHALKKIVEVDVNQIDCPIEWGLNEFDPVKAILKIKWFTSSQSFKASTPQLL